MDYIQEITVVIPALNEESNLRQVLPRVPTEVCGLKVGVLLVDDGSTDHTKDLTREYNVGLVINSTPLGQSEALRRGYRLALAGGAQIVVTMDADGQHRPEEIVNLIKPIVAGAADFVIGSRMLGKYELDDPIRLLGIRVLSQLLSLMIGIKITDCSSGFKAMKSDVLKITIPHLVEKQFDAAEIIIYVAKDGFRILEVPVTILKRIFGKSKKGNNLYFGFSFVKVMLITWMREYLWAAREGDTN